MTRPVVLSDFNAQEWWDYITRVVLEKVNELKSQNAKRSETQTLEEVRFNQGQIHALEDWLLGLPKRELQKITDAAAKDEQRRRGGAS